ncbi:MAG: RRXRR domain-containing protein [Candidatus Bathyarchaeota archaeon]|nr:RRXRR domain-containing protein [Candidatus Bathyarchaeota archaeon]
MDDAFKTAGDSAIERIPVVSADGTPLMPCKPSKARRLLDSGKAFWERNASGQYHLRLRFNPKSPVVRPPSDAKSGIDLNAAYLLGLREAARSRRVLDKALSREERAALDLAVKCVSKPRSPKMIDLLAKIVVRIKVAVMSPLKRLMGQVGKPLAMKISRIATGWGYKAAEKWAEDEGFIRFLTVTSPAFQTYASKRMFSWGF